MTQIPTRRSRLAATALTVALVGLSAVDYLKTRTPFRGEFFALTLLAGGLRAGQGLTQSLNLLVEQLPPRLARDCERAVRDGRLTLEESQSLRRFYDNELSGYTYLEGEEGG